MAKEVGPGEFFDLIFGSAPDGGYVNLATFPRGGRFDPSPDAGPTEQLWFAWPQERNTLVATVNSYSHADLYFCPSVFKAPEGGRRKENVLWLGVNHADADQAQPEVFRLRPSVTVETSPDRHHLYWLLANPGTPEQIEQQNQVIAYTHEDAGCDINGWSSTKLLRVPHTHNNKPGLGQPYRVTSTVEGAMYTSEDVQDAYPLNGAAPLRVHTGEMPTELPSYADALSMVTKYPKIVELLRVKGRAPTRTRQGNRSQLMWALLKEMAENGIPKTAALVLGWEVAYCKVRIRGRHKSEYWREVCRAYEHLGVEEKRELLAAAATPTHRPPAVELLTKSERERVPVTIVDRYIGWAATRTDAARQFHEAAIFTILSCIFGEYGKPSSKFEGGYLNTWFLVLGGTTRSRKSTVRKMMTKMLRHVADDQFFYDLGSNVTPEGLHNELLSRDGLSSLFHRDEVHGLLIEQERKHYLAGLQEMLTELYDGTAQGKLRATGNVTSSKAVETNFVLYMTGVTEHVTDKLSVEDFQSGHLARFLFVHADPPPTTMESVRIEQDEEVINEDGLYVEAEDRAYELLLKELRDAREWWASRVRRGQQVKIFWERDAWERLNEMRYKAILWAENHKHAGVISPTIERTMHTALKMATLLAMAEMQDKVQMHHLLRAVQYVEQCITHLTVVMERMTSTKRTRLLDDIVQTLIQAGNKGVDQHKLYNVFRNDCTMNDFRPMIQDLVAAGQAKINNGQVYAAELA